MERRLYENAPRKGERVGAAGWCTDCGRAWMPARDTAGHVVCGHCSAPEDQEPLAACGATGSATDARR